MLRTPVFTISAGLCEGALMTLRRTSNPTSLYNNLRLTILSTHSQFGTRVKIGTKARRNVM